MISEKKLHFWGVNLIILPNSLKNKQKGNFPPLFSSLCTFTLGYSPLVTSLLSVCPVIFLQCLPLVTSQTQTTTKEESSNRDVAVHR